MLKKSSTQFIYIYYTLHNLIYDRAKPGDFDVIVVQITVIAWLFRDMRHFVLATDGVVLGCAHVIVFPNLELRKIRMQLVYF